MGIRANKLKAKLVVGDVAVGAAVGFHSPDTVELLGALGFDYVTLDLEHEPFSELDVEHSIRAAEAADITPMVRVPNDPDLILRLLDAGAQGIHVPRVNTQGDAEAAVAAARFHPLGKRSFFATARSGNYGIGVSEEEYAAAANRETLVTVQIEEMEGVQNLREILSVPGVDIIQVGPKDLWQSMGMPDRREVQEVVERVIREAVRGGKWVSTYVWLTQDLDTQLERHRELGVHMLTGQAREFFIQGARLLLDQARPGASARRRT